MGPVATCHKGPHSENIVKVSEQELLGGDSIPPNYIGMCINCLIAMDQSPAVNTAAANTLRASKSFANNLRSPNVKTADPLTFYWKSYILQ